MLANSSQVLETLDSINCFLCTIIARFYFVLSCRSTIVGCINWHATHDEHARRSWMVIQY